VELQKTFERKHYFIDPRLQGRYMLTFLVPMLVMLTFMLFTLTVATQGLAKSSASIMREDVDNLVAGALQDEMNPGVEKYEGALEEIRSYLRTAATNARHRHALLVSLLWIFGAGLAIVIVQIVLLTVYFSHKVAGPIYRLEKACNSVIDGDYRERIVLRKGDELQNLAQLLNRVIDLSRERLTALRDASDSKQRLEQSEKLHL
jgi:methyl-accepting chemotaxis protein